jgi:acetate kinase
VLITDEVIEAIRDMIPLAPLHNPANLAGIEVARDFAPGVPQIAVFDTAFHQSLPPHSYLYAIPYRFYEELQVRRYGFHGISHQCVSREAARLLGRAADTINVVSLHLGNGASVTAVQNGRSVDTSMGMTPLEGLVMGTRCGDLDPSIPFYIARWAGLEPGRVEALLNHDSGLKGFCGVGDMREIQRLAAAGEERARLAIDLFCYRIRKYIGAYQAVLGRLDAVVFTGGIGENSPLIRAHCCVGLEHLGIALDEARNRGSLEAAAEIQRPGSAVRILVIRSDEELEIARQTMTRIARSAAG